MDPIVTAYGGEDERERRLLDLLGPLVRAYLYFASAVSSVWGFVFGVVALARCAEPENKKLGKVCLILAVVNTVVVGLCVAIYVAVTVFAVLAAVMYAGGGS
jgi:uncharacterized membrane protein YphA (DoxX/SURF4 family)